MLFNTVTWGLTLQPLSVDNEQLDANVLHRCSQSCSFSWPPGFVLTCCPPKGLYAVTTCPMNMEVGTMTAPHAIGAVTNFVTSCCPAGKLEKVKYRERVKMNKYVWQDSWIIFKTSIRFGFCLLTGSVGPVWRWPRWCLVVCCSVVGWCWSAARWAAPAGKSSWCYRVEQILSPGSGAEPEQVAGTGVEAGDIKKIISSGEWHFNFNMFYLVARSHCERWRGWAKKKTVWLNVCCVMVNMLCTTSCLCEHSMTHMSDTHTHHLNGM